MLNVFLSINPKPVCCCYISYNHRLYACYLLQVLAFEALVDMGQHVKMFGYMKHLGMHMHYEILCTA